MERPLLLTSAIETNGINNGNAGAPLVPRVRLSAPKSAQRAPANALRAFRADP